MIFSRYCAITVAHLHYHQPGDQRTADQDYHPLGLAQPLQGSQDDDHDLERQRLEVARCCCGGQVVARHQVELALAQGLQGQAIKDMVRC
jgi:hypothetical protein